MAVAIIMISVVIKRSAIESAFEGGWSGFVNQVPNETLCHDDHLARVAFMNGRDATSYAEKLGEKGLRSGTNGKTGDITIVGRTEGGKNCKWLETGAVAVKGGDKPTVFACWLKGTEIGEVVVGFSLPPLSKAAEELNAEGAK